MLHKRLSRNIIYKSPWVNLYVDKVVFPDGAIIEKHHFLDFERQAVAAIIENHKEEILLIQSYRYTTNSIEWEIPAGGIEKGETPCEAGKREALEETGYSITEPELLYTYNPANGISNQVFNVIKAKSISKVGTFDKNEVKDIKWVSLNEIREMIKENKIRCGLSLTALLLHLNSK